MRLATFMAIADKPGLFQDTKVLRDRGLRNPGPSRKAPNRLLAIPTQPFE